MKIFNFLLVALLSVGADAVKGPVSRSLRQDGNGGDCTDDGTYSPQEGDCEICSRCNKENGLDSVKFRYNPDGQNSRYQSTDFATCVGGSYPSSATVTAAGQTFSVSAGTEFQLLASGNGGKFDANTVFSITGVVDCTIHLSCSAPIVAGDQIGPFEVLGKDTCDGSTTPTEDCSFDGCLVCDPDNKEFPNGDSRKPTSLTFVYRAAGKDSVYQGESFASCRAASYPSSTTISVEGQTFSVSDGDQFTVLTEDDKFPAELDFTFSGFGDCFIHASCSVPIIAGDQIGPLEVVGDDKVCLPCEDVCLKADKKEYDCGDAITIDFDITDVTDGLGQTGALSSDWIGIYPCDVPFSDETFRFSIINKYVCDQFTDGDSARCSLDTSTSYNKGTVVIDRLPAYGEIGPYIWPVTAFREGGAVTNSFKAVIMRDDGPSVPPYIPICESECFTITPDATTRECEIRDNPVELNPAATGGGFGCFPGDAIVAIEGQGKVQMKDIRLGDKVLASNNNYETVYSFGHRNEVATMEFVKLVTASATLELSKDHLVYVHSKTVPASIVKVGDNLQLADGTIAPVRAIKSTNKIGVYAPFTVSGSIIVNGLTASTFVAFQDRATIHVAGIDTGVSFQAVADFFEFPHRVWCLALSTCDSETYTAEGISTWVDVPHKIMLALFNGPSDYAMIATVAMVALTASKSMRSTKKVQ